MLLAPGLALSDRPLRELQVGDVVSPDESISVGPRAVRLPQGHWRLVALNHGENRTTSLKVAKVTTGVFARIDGSRTLAVAFFSASEEPVTADVWERTPGCESAQVRFRDRFGSPLSQPECHEVLVLANFLGSGVKGIWADARQRLSDLGVGWASKQLWSRYHRFIWSESLQFSIYVNPRLFAPKGTRPAQANDELPQAFLDWSAKQVEQLRLLSERKISVFRLGDLPDPADTAAADLPPTQVRPLKTDDGAVSDVNRFPCKGGTCPDLLKRYLDYPMPKALVVAQGRAFSHWGGEDPLAYAIDNCRRQAQAPETCQMYAVNNELVWKPE
jgi:hypothetical protein